MKPSKCAEGYMVESDFAPWLLGKGFGPKPYQELFDIWTAKISTKSLASYDQKQVQLVQELVQCLRTCEQKYREEYFSCMVAPIFQRLAFSFCDLDRDWDWMDVVHQTCAHNSTISGADIAVLRRVMGESVMMQVHALLEIKWGFQPDRFPEAQACAYAMSFQDAKSCTHWWLPTFVLTKNSFQIGVSFNAMAGRWAFSEIVSYNKVTFFDDSDVIHLLHFAEFLFLSANVHHSCVDFGIVEWPIVDKTGVNSFNISSIRGSRVFCTGHNRVFKLYESTDIARKILATQKTIDLLLGYSSNPVLIEGCDSENGGLCAVVEDFYLEDSNITFGHIKSLVDTVDILWTAGFVHGDFRRQNIVFAEGNKAKLIDWEWCGQVGIAKYPTNVNRKAFLSRSSRYVQGDGLIRQEIDWLCLADIFDSMRLPQVANAAAQCMREAVVQMLCTHDFVKDVEWSSLVLEQPGPFNLTCLGGRLADYYSRQIDLSGKLVPKSSVHSGSSSQTLGVH
jgi:hypothetical protein